jgi:cell wall-associated NlpC family hydrolase
MKKRAYCRFSLIPVKAAPGHKEEQVDQLLFGEEYWVVEEKEEWAFIQCLPDLYPGWILKNQVTVAPAGDENQFQRLYFVDEPFALARPDLSPDVLIPLSVGTLIPDVEGQHFSLWGEDYAISGKLSPVIQAHQSSDVIRTACHFLAAPYQWGGKTPLGIDCSGLTQLVFRAHGYTLPRDAWMQSEKGIGVDYDDALQGDLAFFGENSTSIKHVGIIMENRQIIHSSGFVRIDALTNMGILRTKDQTLTHKLQTIRRLIC